MLCALGHEEIWGADIGVLASQSNLSGTKDDTVVTVEVGIVVCPDPVYADDEPGPKPHHLEEKTT